MSKKCDICGKEFDEWGNNPWPFEGTVCCDVCNETKVVPARIARHFNNKKEKIDDVTNFEVEVNISLPNNIRFYPLGEKSNLDIDNDGHAHYYYTRDCMEHDMEIMISRQGEIWGYIGDDEVFYNNSLIRANMTHAEVVEVIKLLIDTITEKYHEMFGED